MCTFFNSMLSITAVREDCFSGGLPLPTFVPLSTVSMFFQKNFNLLSVTAPIWRKKIREMTAAGIDLSTNMPAHKPQHPLSKRRLQSFAFLHFFFFLLKLIKSLNISWKLNEIESVCGMILTDQSRLILIVSKLVYTECAEDYNKLFFSEICCQHGSGYAFCPASQLPHASMCNWRGSPLQLRAMGKQLKKYFVAGFEPKGFNYDSPLGTVFLVRSAGSDSGLDLGATSCKQTETETLLLSPRCTVANRINKLVAQELLKSLISWAQTRQNESGGNKESNAREKMSKHSINIGEWLETGETTSGWGGKSEAASERRELSRQ